MNSVSLNYPSNVIKGIIKVWCASQSIIIFKQYQNILYFSLFLFYEPDAVLLPLFHIHAVLIAMNSLRNHHDKRKENVDEYLCQIN